MPRLAPACLLAVFVAACADSSTGPDRSSCAQCVVTIPASRDNTLYEDAAGLSSNGSGESMIVGGNTMGLTRRALIHFDVAAFLPVGATIDSVRLYLTTMGASGGPRMIRLHRATSGWGQASSDPPAPEDPGAPAAPGDATWLHAFFPDSLWTRPGGDFVATPSGSTVVDGAFVTYTWPTTPLTTADVQAWLDVPSGNFGWVITGAENRIGTTKAFATRENPVVARRPLLEVFFRPG